MSVVFADTEKKLTVQVNEGTSSNPSLKNRALGTGYWINPDTSTADNEKVYQLGVYFGALQAYTVNDYWVETRAKAVEN